MKLRPAVMLALAAVPGCDGTGVEAEPTVQLTVRITVAGGRDVGATLGKVYVFANSLPFGRASALPEDGQVCSVAVTPVTTCSFTIPRRSPVSLVAAEPDPAVFVRFEEQDPQDTLRDGKYVEFTGWSECDDREERGVCVIRPSRDTTIDANYQLMQQVTVYQTGAARLDFITFSSAPTLKVPAQGNNILDLAGCRHVLLDRSRPCDPIRRVGDTPYHRFTAFVPRQTIVAMIPTSGVETEFVRWDGDCVLSATYGGGVCSLISPAVSGSPILLTLRFTWWDCPTGPSDGNTGTCVLKEP